MAISTRMETTKVIKAKTNSQSRWNVSWFLSQHLKHRKIKGLNKRYFVNLKPLERELERQ